MKLEHIYKDYFTSNDVVSVLKDINIEFKPNNLYAIMGRSGAGKTTLVNILGLLDSSTKGKYYLGNVDTTVLDENKKSEVRGKNIGFVFQSFYLNDKLTALENVMLPLFINDKVKKNERKELAKQILTKLGLGDRYNHKPSQLSGGEQQRVAIARALINNPKILIADEPTGNLDAKNEDEVFKILKNISKEGKIVIVVCHNEKIKNYCDHLYEIVDGSLECRL